MGITNLHWIYFWVLAENYLYLLYLQKRDSVIFFKSLFRTSRKIECSLGSLTDQLAVTTNYQKLETFTLLQPLCWILNTFFHLFCEFPWLVMSHWFVFVWIRLTAKQKSSVLGWEAAGKAQGMKFSVPNINLKSLLKLMWFCFLFSSNLVKSVGK